VPSVEVPVVSTHNLLASINLWRGKVLSPLSSVTDLSWRGAVAVGGHVGQLNTELASGVIKVVVVSVKNEGRHELLIGKMVEKTLEEIAPSRTDNRL